MKVEIRWARQADGDALRRFFAAAYGETSVFTNARFLKWFLGARDGEGFNSVIATERGGKIVAHYGASRSTLSLCGKSVGMWWGVNAFTLPRYRGKGFGRQLLLPFLECAEVFGVIGFAPRTADFYEREGFNLLGRSRFTRYARVLDGRLSGLATMYGKDPQAVSQRFPVRPWQTADGATLRAGLPRSLQLGVDDALTTTLRTREHLEHRFTAAPAPRYSIATSPDGSAYLCFRVLTLAPTEHLALTIVDLAGSPATARGLVEGALTDAARAGCLYVDFAALGGAYGETLRMLGFEQLENADVELLPMLTSPMAPRENHEFVGIYSRAHSVGVSALRASGVYFTRADSDRDRATRLADLESPQ